MSKQAVFIAATGKDVGKTTLCLGILSGLQKRFSKVGFMKPLGQQHITIQSGHKVDKDVVLFKEHFSIDTSYEKMSPSLLPSGFTKSYLEGKIDSIALQKNIDTSFREIQDQNDFTVVEGTGHVGVGSIVGLSNAQVAKNLGLEAIIVTSGGLGSSHDELALNISLFRELGVPVRGIILNRVLPEKKEMIETLFPKALEHWNIPLIGCIPYNQFLSTPTMSDYEGLFQAKLIAGESHRLRHFKEMRLVAGSLEIYQRDIAPNELVITPACRHEIIQAVLRNHLKNPEMTGGIILTGRHPPSEKTLTLIKQSDVPVLYAPMCSYDAMKMITSFIAKIRIEDTEKIEYAIDHVEAHINFDILTGTHAKTK